MAKLFSILVVENGIENPIHWVTDGTQAIEYLEGCGSYVDCAKHPLPKVVISDLKMPRLSGLELLDWIKSHKELRLLPVLVMTSSDLKVDVNTAYGLGAASFFTKPTSFENLRRLTKTIHEYWRHCVEPDVSRRPSTLREAVPT